MDGVVAVIASAGAWLLLAGPLLQAALELRDETTAHAAVRAPMPSAAAVSPWAWLFPPLAIERHLALRRRVRKHQLASLNEDEVRENVLFSTRATGWLLVAGGAFLIALKETWQAGEAFRIPAAAIAVVIVVLLVLTTTAAALHTARTGRLLLHGGPSGGRRGAMRAAAKKASESDSSNSELPAPRPPAS